MKSLLSKFAIFHHNQVPISFTYFHNKFVFKGLFLWLQKQTFFRVFSPIKKLKMSQRTSIMEEKQKSKFLKQYHTFIAAAGQSVCMSHRSGLSCYVHRTYDPSLFSFLFIFRSSFSDLKRLICSMM